MQYGMNLLLWTTDLEESEFHLLEKIKKFGYDGVEIPIFNLDVDRFKAIGAKCDELGLERTAVTVSTAEENPISPDAAIRQAAVERLKLAVDCCAAAGAFHLCGPFHSALGEFTGSGRTDDEWNAGKEEIGRAACRERV